MRARPRPSTGFSDCRHLGLRVFVLSLLLALPGLPNSRLKDIAEFEGVRDNLLFGYCLVVGLNGSGESLRNSAFTDESLR